ncbi:PEP-CTERM system TPR-repeat protein PrsT [Massilia forsythiae]|uniref:PEP-CTERM system TPR-repeat protein PrsT n=1 Tax=Massilia forsythiae TaxID=2728020 RepID=A0A7Z2ZS36_9BURK|nr:XrtA/PEP-CTERM system TPR-repeat protein PrsT [Massilia forsythiae]QJD99873.1 PEP-CTERM system TPR-repeat protein PrsT [Massilia forsythiae]
MSRHASKLKLTAALVSGALLMAGLSACGKSESTATLMAEAKQYQQKGDLKSALIQLKNAVEKSPEDGEARMQLAMMELDMGDAVSADKELRKARSLGIAADRVLPLLGKTDMLQGKAKELLDDISAEQAARSAPLLTLRGDALLVTGKGDDAKTAYEQALAVNPNAGDALLGLARLAASKQDREGAERYVNDAVAKDPKNPEVWMARGALLRATGKADEALAAYDETLKLKPDHRSAHIEKAYLQITRGKFPEAKVEIDAAEKASPGNLLVTYTRALYEFAQGKYAASQDALQKVLKSAPDHMPSVLLAGASELNLGATQQAEQHLRRYLEANPNDVYARKLLAQTLLKRAQPADAAAALAPVLNESTQDPQLLALAGESYMQVRDFGKASAYLEKASTLAPKAAAVRTSLGLSKLAQGDQARGLSELELATALDPKSTQAAVALVQTEMQLKHFDKALAAVQSLEKQQPDNPQVQNLKGGVYMIKGDPANARAAFEKAVALQPTFLPAVTNLARLDLQDKKPDAAKGRFEKVLEKDKNNADAMGALGELALVQKHTDEATSWFEKASNANPDAVAPALKLGAHYLRTNQPQKALTLARKFQTANPTNPELLDMLGQAQVATKDTNGALETYSKLVNAAPKSPQAQLRLAGVHLMMKNDSAASADLKRAVELQPNFIPARLVQVDMAMRAGRSDEALDIARQLQKLDPKSAAGYVIEGDVMMSQNKPAQALPSYEKGLAISNAPELFVKTMQALGASGKTKEVRSRAQQWLVQHPDDVRIALMLAETNLAAKEYKPAIAVLEDTLKRVPNNPLVLNNLAWAYQQEKDPRALATAEQAYKLAGDNPGVMDTLGWMLVEQGNAGRGLPLLQKASGLAPNAVEIRYHLAVALSKNGDKQGARKELDKVLAQNTPFPQIDEARALLKTL